MTPLPDVVLSSTSPLDSLMILPSRSALYSFSGSWEGNTLVTTFSHRTKSKVQITLLCVVIEEGSVMEISVRASTKSNSCLLVSLFYYCRCIYRTKCTNVLRRHYTEQRTHDKDWYLCIGLSGLPGEGERERGDHPPIYRSSQTLWCLLPGPLLWPPEQIGHCEHLQFLFWWQRVSSRG